jgi:hypothetical protein
LVLGVVTIHTLLCRAETNTATCLPSGDGMAHSAVICLGDHTTRDVPSCEINRRRLCVGVTSDERKPSPLDNQSMLARFVASWTTTFLTGCPLKETMRMRLRGTASATTYEKLCPSGNRLIAPVFAGALASSAPLPRSGSSEEMKTSESSPWTRTHWPWAEQKGTPLRTMHNSWGVPLRRTRCRCAA